MIRAALGSAEDRLKMVRAVLSDKRIHDSTSDEAQLVLVLAWLVADDEGTFTMEDVVEAFKSRILVTTARMLLTEAGL